MVISDKAAGKFIDREQEVRLYREQKEKTERCNSCGYRSYIADVGIICAYILKEGHSRPCKPGNGCTAYIESERPFHDPFQFGSMTTAVIKDGRKNLCTS